MFINAKIGTGPAGKYKALWKRNAPKIGDVLWLRGIGEFDWEDMRVRVTKVDIVDERPFYFVERH